MGRSRSIAEHLEAVLALATTREPVTIDVREALGVVLASDAVAALPVPPFSNSAMDGFLVHTATLQGEGPWTFEVIGDVPAGAEAINVPPAAAVRIMTGAPVGTAFEHLRVIPVEDTDIPPGPTPLPSSITVHRFRETRAHIRPAGENISPGDLVAPAGMRIDAGAIASLISCGVDKIKVYPRPRVGVISSGDELVAPGITPGLGQLPDSNRPMVVALLQELGLVEIKDVHASDAGGDFRELLNELSTTYDLVITTGGISVGAFDVVRDVTGSGDMWFGTVAQRPGSAQGLGSWGGAVLLCLPGNPVAAFATFSLYVPPLISAMSGGPRQVGMWERPYVLADVAESATLVSSPDRSFLAPVHVSWSKDRVIAAPFNRRATGSHLVASLAATNGLAVIESGAPPPIPGSVVRVLLRHL